MKMDATILDVLEDTLKVIAVVEALSTVKSIKPCRRKKKPKVSKKRWSNPHLLQRDLVRDLQDLPQDELELTDFKKFLRMDQAIFENLLTLVEGRIKKKNTFMRECISVERRLAVTLRFLATGETFTTLSVGFRIAACTISKIVPETCRAIYDVLKKKYMQVPDTPGKFKEISTEFEALQNFPHCLGALDGKQMKFCHSKTKEMHTVLLLGIIDAQLKFQFADVLFDEDYTESRLKQAIDNNTISFPKCGKDSLPYVIISDNTFPLEEKVMTPYSDEALTEEEMIFNDRLNSARSVAENAFGILSDRFRVLLETTRLSFDTVSAVIFACFALHNLLITENNSSYLNEESECSWQEKYLENATCRPATRSNFSARRIRNKFCQHFQKNL